jgi:hypothetical protein
LSITRVLLKDRSIASHSWTVAQNLPSATPKRGVLRTVSQKCWKYALVAILYDIFPNIFINIMLSLNEHLYVQSNMWFTCPTIYL